MQVYQPDLTDSRASLPLFKMALLLDIDNFYKLWRFIRRKIGIAV